MRAAQGTHTALRHGWHTGLEGPVQPHFSATDRICWSKLYRDAAAGALNLVLRSQLRFWLVKRPSNRHLARTVGVFSTQR